MDQRVHVAVEDHARGGLNGALNARRDLGSRCRRDRIVRRSQCDYDGEVQRNEQRDPKDGTQQFHAYIIGSFRSGL